MHNRGFVYEPRGFTSIEDMNEAIVERHNSIVKDDDEVWVLGDLMLNDNIKGLEYISKMKGKLHIIRGNHDTNTRISLYKTLSNVVEVHDAAYLKYNGYHFYLSHFPCYTGNLEKESLKQMTINIHGHTHSKSNFYQDIPFMYHCGVDAHECWPVSNYK